MGLSTNMLLKKQSDNDADTTEHSRKNLSVFICTEYKTFTDLWKKTESTHCWNTSSLYLNTSDNTVKTRQESEPKHVDTPEK